MFLTVHPPPGRPEETVSMSENGALPEQCYEPLGLLERSKGTATLSQLPPQLQDVATICVNRKYVTLTVGVSPAENAGSVHVFLLGAGRAALAEHRLRAASAPPAPAACPSLRPR